MYACNVVYFIVNKRKTICNMVCVVKTLVLLKVDIFIVESTNGCLTGCVRCIWIEGNQREESRWR